MDQNELSLDPRHVGVPSGVLKMIYEPMVRSMQTVHLSCAEMNTISKQTQNSCHLTHVTYEFHQVRPKQFPSLWYVQRVPCTYHASRLALYPKGQNELPREPLHLVVPSSASKPISESMVCRAQTMHLSCTDTNTISKWKEVRFHMTTPPRSCIGCVQTISGLWHVRRKSWSYLASRLSLSPNGPKRAST